MLKEAKGQRDLGQALGIANPDVAGGLALLGLFIFLSEPNGDRDNPILRAGIHAMTT